MKKLQFRMIGMIFLISIFYVTHALADCKSYTPRGAGPVNAWFRCTSPQENQFIPITIPQDFVYTRNPNKSYMLECVANDPANPQPDFTDYKIISNIVTKVNLVGGVNATFAYINISGVEELPYDQELFDLIGANTTVCSQMIN